MCNMYICTYHLVFLLLMEVVIFVSFVSPYSNPSFLVCFFLSIFATLCWLYLTLRSLMRRFLLWLGIRKSLSGFQYVLASKAYLLVVKTRQPLHNRNVLTVEKCHTVSKSVQRYTFRNLNAFVSLLVVQPKNPSVISANRKKYLQQTPKPSPQYNRRYVAALVCKLNPFQILRWGQI